MIAREYRELPIDLVDEPDAPTRQRITGESIEEMKLSLLEHGQLQPGGVVPNGDRFSISYGHRRFLGCKAAGLPFYCAYVYASDSAAMLGAQLAENADREDVNPVDEAFWFAQLMDAGVGDCDELAQLLKRTRTYVEDRLLLLTGDVDVRAALQTGKIGLGVAKLLNKYADDVDRKVLLDAAIAGGASARLVAEWIADRRKLQLARGSLPAVDAAALAASPEADAPKPLSCLYCDSDEEVWSMQPLWIHKSCLNLLRKVLTTHMGGFVVRTTEEVDKLRAAVAPAR